MGVFLRKKTQKCNMKVNGLRLSERVKLQVCEPISG